MDKLPMLFCFKKWRNEGLNMSTPNYAKSKFIMINSHLDNPSNELIIYTDGSCDKLRIKAGIGIHF